MQRSFSGIMAELPEVKCLIHITCTKAPQISRHLHQNELKLWGGDISVYTENGLLAKIAEKTFPSKVLYRLRYSG